MKKLLSLVLAALCALLPALSALAESTTLMTTVPFTHLITIICGEHGKVILDGTSYSGTFTVDAPRLGSLVIAAAPDSGYDLSQIAAEHLDGVSIHGRKVTLTSIHAENTLTFSFCKLPDEEASAKQEGTGETESDGSILYQNYLGTGDGLGQLHIVFSGDYLPEDYELLHVLYEAAPQANCVWIRAFPDEKGNVVRRSLILSVPQLMKLQQEQKAVQLLFENGNATAKVALSDLLDGNLSKLMALILSGDDEITEETLHRDWNTAAPVEISAERLKPLKVETRMIPSTLEDGALGCDVSVWLRWAEHELEVSNMLPSLTVAIAAEELASGESPEVLDTQYILAYQAPMDSKQAERMQLSSTPLWIPNLPSALQEDTAAHFIVTVSDQREAPPVIAYEAHADLASFRHYALAAPYVGSGTYWMLKAE